MIAAAKLHDALGALNAILVLARSLAHEGKAADLVVVLDLAEYLPRLMAEEADRTAEFRAQLVSLAEQFPLFGFAVERFDGLSPSW